MTIKTWVKIPDYPGYSASSDGEIRADKSRWPSMSGRILSQSRAGAGYLKVSPVAVTVYVHHLVASAYLGKRPKGMQINHKDGNKNNNAPSNLEYVTASENGKHAAISLGKHRGEASGTSKLTAMQVRAILSDIRPHAKIAADYKVSQATVTNIKLGKTWRNISRLP